MTIHKRKTAVPVQKGQHTHHKKCRPKCRKHVFSLKQRRNFFKNRYQLTTNQKIYEYPYWVKLCTCNTLDIPVINVDGKYLTPYFVHRNYQANVEESADKSSSEEESSRILVPKPRKMFCAICKDTFQDYLEHIQEFNHKRLCVWGRQSTGIDELIEKYRVIREQQLLQNGKTAPLQDTAEAKKAQNE